MHFSQEIKITRAGQPELVGAFCFLLLGAGAGAAWKTKYYLVIPYKFSHFWKSLKSISPIFLKFLIHSCVTYRWKAIAIFQVLYTFMVGRCLG